AGLVDAINQALNVAAQNSRAESIELGDSVRQVLIAFSQALGNHLRLVGLERDTLTDNGVDNPNAHVVALRIQKRNPNHISVIADAFLLPLAQFLQEDI